MSELEDDKKRRHVPGGRVSRFLKLGSLSGVVGASMVGEKLAGVVRSGASKDEALRRVMEKNAARIVRTMGDMKGAAMKLGQMMSNAPVDKSRLPPEVQEALSVLQRQAPPMGWELVASQVEKAFDRPISDVFKFFEPEPMAAASIGQVHAATLFDDTRVAVKVQYPGVVESLDADLKNLSTLMQLGKAFVDRGRIDEYAAEVRAVILAESDYEAEGRNLARFAELLAPWTEIRVPRVYPELTRRTVLTMEFVEGEKLDVWLKAQPKAERDRLALRFAELFVRMFQELHALHVDPHPGNFLMGTDGRFVLLDFGAVKTFEPAFTDGFIEILVAMWQGRYEKLPSLYEDIGFGTEDGVDIPPEVLKGWLEIITEPFLTDGEFDFGTWAPQQRMQRHMLTHPEMRRLLPPKDAIFYGRVLGGIWGLLQRLEVKGNVRELAEATARRRGYLPDAGAVA